MQRGQIKSDEPVREYNEETTLPTLEEKTLTLPLIPLPDLVVFPGAMTPLVIGRQRSLRAMEEAISNGMPVALVLQKDPTIMEPRAEDLQSIGTVADLFQPMPFPDHNVRVLAEGRFRFRLLQITRTDPYYLALVEEIPETRDADPETMALERLVRRQFEQLVQNSRSIPPDALMTIAGADDPSRIADLIASFVDLKTKEKQEILETLPVKARLRKLAALLERELQVLDLEKRIESKVREGVTASQREFILRERLKAIQEELGERDIFMAEVEELRDQVNRLKLPDPARQRALKELDRLEKMPPMSPETGVIRTYLDWILSLPWKKRTKDNLDIDRAQKVLDEDHYGLKDIKERILEFLAVRKLTEKTRGPILCFIGPPGVGKTSIGKSIARAMGRKFVRMSLGGIRDEAEIRGHRRTYVGALPGRIIQGMRQAGTKNPVFMLDEIDKIGLDWRGDPTAALLEALDPEQNNAFSDHYIEVPFDLSEVLFILTGNVTDTIPPALRDRLEVLHFPGYTEDEKIQIAVRHLIPKNLDHHGLTQTQLTLSESVLSHIIRHYTQEAGVRNLERQLATIMRKVAVQVAKGKMAPARVTLSSVEKFLGPPKFRLGEKQSQDEVGVATGLAWTGAGGDVLSVEVTLLQGSGRLALTGQLGEIMQESAKAALTYARTVLARLGLEDRYTEKTDVHIHVPAGSVPKDGPSAGITMAVALVSALTRLPVRADVGMTGEVTLRGRILPVGGIKEKILGAHRAGLRTVIIPKENQKDLKDLPPKVLRDLQIIFVEHMDEVLPIALPAFANLKPRVAQPVVPAGA
ncbi:MAG: endopeptidase La [Armatimonadetes bacterium]|nr:endopeptidase La [Armatimonadota bacterium]MDW8121235.1 endopeptidase La [Armatimonadota bacterium]